MKGTNQDANRAKQDRQQQAPALQIFVLIYALTLQAFPVTTCKRGCCYSFSYHHNHHHQHFLLFDERITNINRKGKGKVHPRKSHEDPEGE